MAMFIIRSYRSCLKWRLKLVEVLELNGLQTCLPAKAGKSSFYFKTASSISGFKTKRIWAKH